MIVAEIGLNHLGNEKLLKKYIKILNNSDVDAITIQVIKKDFFLKNNILKFYIEKQRLYNLIFSQCEKKIGLIIDEIDENIYKFKKRINFFKILGDQINNKILLKKLVNLKKLIYISNKNTNNKEKKYLNFLSKKNKLINVIHTQDKNRTELKYSKLNNIIKIHKVTRKKPAFGLHCNDTEVLKYALMFKPKDIFFYIKDNNSSYKYPDNLHAISLKNLDKTISDIVYINNSMKDWR